MLKRGGLEAVSTLVKTAVAEADTPPIQAAKVTKAKASQALLRTHLAQIVNNYPRDYKIRTFVEVLVLSIHYY